MVFPDMLGSTVSAPKPSSNFGEYAPLPAPTQALASGGRLRPGRVALVGEEGPELLAPSPGGRTVIPNGAGGGGPAQYHFHFSGGVTHADLAAILPQVQQQTIGAISQLQKRGGRL
jgi:hypothetical protein